MWLFSRSLPLNHHFYQAYHLRSVTALSPQGKDKSSPLSHIVHILSHIMLNGNTVYCRNSTDSCRISWDTYQAVKGDISLLSVLPLTHPEGKYREILCLLKNPQTPQVSCRLSAPQTSQEWKSTSKTTIWSNRNK